LVQVLSKTNFSDQSLYGVKIIAILSTVSYPFGCLTKLPAFFIKLKTLYVHIKFSHLHKFEDEYIYISVKAKKGNEWQKSNEGPLALLIDAD
jgi:hypothetical protein